MAHSIVQHTSVHNIEAGRASVQQTNSQALSQSVSQSVRQPARQSASQSASQPGSHSASQPVSQAGKSLADAWRMNEFQLLGCEI